MSLQKNVEEFFNLVKLHQLESNFIYDASSLKSQQLCRPKS